MTFLCAIASVTRNNFFLCVSDFFLCKCNQKRPLFSASVTRNIFCMQLTPETTFLGAGVTKNDFFCVNVTINEFFVCKCNQKWFFMCECNQKWIFYLRVFSEMTFVCECNQNNFLCDCNVNQKELFFQV